MSCSRFLAVDEAEGLPTVDGIPNLEAIQAPWKFEEDQS